MGCASSGPIGKNLVDGAQDALGNVEQMGENAIHDIGDKAKDGMEHVKEAMESAFHTAEDGIGTAIDKIEETIGIKKNEVEKIDEDMKEAVEAFEEAIEDESKHHAEPPSSPNKVNEEISETETVLASDPPETVHTTTEVESTPPPPIAEDGTQVEDIETDQQDHGMGSTVDVDDSKKNVEELVAVANSAPSPPPKEEEELTPWERAADAIINRPVNPSMQINDQDVTAEEDATLEKERDAEIDRDIREELTTVLQNELNMEEKEFNTIAENGIKDKDLMELEDLEKSMDEDEKMIKSYLDVENYIA